MLFEEKFQKVKVIYEFTSEFEAELDHDMVTSMLSIRKSRIKSVHDRIMVSTKMCQEYRIQS